MPWGLLYGIVWFFCGRNTRFKCCIIRTVKWLSFWQPLIFYMKGGEIVDELLALGLTKMDTVFLLELAKGIPLEAAYKKAHPKMSKKSINSNASPEKDRLLKKPGVLDWWKANSAECENINRQLKTYEDKRENLSKIIDYGMQNGDFYLVLKATDLDNKMTGTYETKTKVDGNVSLTIGWGESDDK